MIKKFSSPTSTLLSASKIETWFPPPLKLRTGRRAGTSTSSVQMFFSGFPAYRQASFAVLSGAAPPPAPKLRRAGATGSIFFQKIEMKTPCWKEVGNPRVSQMGVGVFMCWGQDSNLRSHKGA